MTWILLCVLAMIIFINRYLFLEPQVKIILPKIVQDMLKYSAPCLLMALCTPMLFFEGNHFRNPLWVNEYFMSAIICVFLAILSDKILVNWVVALFSFYALSYFLN